MAQAGQKTLMIPPRPQNLQGPARMAALESQVDALIALLDEAHRNNWRDVAEISRVEVPRLETRASTLETNIDFEIPLLRDITWTWPGNVITWSAGTLLYKNVSYPINAGDGGDNTKRGVYLDVSSLSDPVTLSTIATPTSVVDRWYVAFFDGSSVYPVLQSPILHAGLLQVNSVLATQINTTDLFVSNDVVIGDYTGGAGMFWDQSEGIFAIKGTMIIGAGSSYTGNAIGTAYTAAKATDPNADQTAANTANNAANYTGNAIATTYTAAKATDPNADQTSANETYGSGAEVRAGTGWSHNSDLTLINGGDIYTNSIVVDSIAARTITTAELTITGSDRLQTANMDDNSITAWYSMQFTTPVTLVTANTYYTCMNLNYTRATGSTSSSLAVFATLEIEGLGGGTNEFIFWKWTYDVGSGDVDFPGFSAGSAGGHEIANNRDRVIVSSNLVAVGGASIRIKFWMKNFDTGNKTRYFGGTLFVLETAR